MPLGLSDRRTTNGTAPVLAFLLMVTAGSAGCNAVPFGSRATPKEGEVRTRVGPDRDRGAMKIASDEPAPLPATAPSPLAFDRLDQESPLPPALDRPPVRVELPPETPATKPDPTPILDEAVARADARTGAIADEVARAAEAKAAPKVELTNLLLRTTPEPTPVATATATAPTSPAPAPKSPDETWREGVQTLRALARDRLKDEARPRGPGGPNWAVRDRLLGWLAEPDIDPDPRSGDQVAQGRAVLKGLAAVLDPSGSPTSRGAEIREAVAALEAEAPLEVSELKVCVKVHGFGNIEPLDPPVGHPGKPLIVYCEMVGLAYEPMGPAFRSRLATQVDLLPEGSETPAWSQSMETAEDACRRRRRDYYISYPLRLPDNLGPGIYRLRLTQRDLVTDRTAVRETGITVAK